MGQIPNIFFGKKSQDDFEDYFPLSHTQVFCIANMLSKNIPDLMTLLKDIFCPRQVNIPSIVEMKGKTYKAEEKTENFEVCLRGSNVEALATFTHHSLKNCDAIYFTRSVESKEIVVEGRLEEGNIEDEKTLVAIRCNNSYSLFFIRQGKKE